MAYEYGEGNGSQQSRVNAIGRAAQLERLVGARMRDLEADDAP